RWRGSRAACSASWPGCSGRGSRCSPPPRSSPAASTSRPGGWRSPPRPASPLRWPARWPRGWRPPDAVCGARWSRGGARLPGRRADARRGFLLVSAGRRGGALNRGLTVVGLLLAFGVNLGLFSATYDQQADVDAQLTLGADVTVTAPPGVAAGHDLAGRIARV